MAAMVTAFTSSSFTSALNFKQSSLIPSHNNNQSQHFIVSDEDNDNANVEEVDVEQVGLQRETLLYSCNPLSLMLLAALPGADTVRSVFGPFAELVKTFNLPDWLVHWGHPANMAVVLFAMGGYGTYLGFRIKFSDDVVCLRLTMMQHVL
ncbi:uncharacterized protein LOC141590069 [Silene latifolia]|uniref:uncharacterized protein LOC141590069 n=1 Tax=Silene latifolia TaxID=37657 RepID=UPI003D779962